MKQIKEISILEVGTHKIGSESPVGVVHVSVKQSLHVSYTPHAKDLSSSFLAVLALTGHLVHTNS